ncbi:hypothetical protein LX36DRAFT_346965 [Colletotrichum falcatum]|nr:hypothetical protein LX36DRAFT_346965 [Colletotrichum falcatum]
MSRPSVSRPASPLHPRRLTVGVVYVPGLSAGRARMTNSRLWAGTASPTPAARPRCPRVIKTCALLVQGRKSVPLSRPAERWRARARATRGDKRCSYQMPTYRHTRHHLPIRARKRAMFVCQQYAAGSRFGPRYPFVDARK